MSDFKSMLPDEYAALWGCDPVYDQWPRQRGDGYKFYNYSVQQDDPEFLRQFIPAIDRTIKSVEMNPDVHEPHDVEDLLALRDHVEDRLAGLIAV
jgi:L-alanine-DL-glutamate epimerase-like enolase superfamily enzyme